MKFKLTTAGLIFTILLLAACSTADISTSPELPTRTPITVATFPPTYTPKPTATDQPTTPPRPTSTQLIPTAVPTLTDPITNIQTYLETISERGNFSGAVWVARGDEVLINEGYGLANREAQIPITTETRFKITTLTQTFTALGIMILQERGQIDVQDPVCIYLSDCPEAWQSISTENLLLHTSGITEYTAIQGYTQTRLSPASPRTLVDSFITQPLLFEPGAKWEHSNSNYILLGYLIEQVGGQTYQDFIRSNILSPSGMNNSGFFIPADDQFAMGYVREGIDWVAQTPTVPSVGYSASGMVSTIEDLSAWDQALFSGQLVSQEMLDEIFSAHYDTAYGGVGYGWFISRANNRTLVRHAGTADGYTASMVHYPEDQVSIIVLSNVQDLAVNALIDRIGRELFRDQ